MNTFYTDERNTQILISLMKAHGVRKVVASPGTTNICFVASIQQDPFFEIYSSVDERSAAYIACGLAAESGEPVALSCTGATASRNYVSGLTEAYYRKLPILAITSAQHYGRIGQNIPQAIDRTVQMNDIARLSIQVPTVHDANDEWACNVSINKALLELRRHGGGPVHINLTTTYSENFSVKKLPEERVINRICPWDNIPAITGNKVAILVGAHVKWSKQLLEKVDEFCSLYNGVVICDHTSNYKGKYQVMASLVCNQTQYEAPCRRVEVLIHMGDISGVNLNMHPKQVWRVNPDGEVRDTFKKLRYVFEMQEEMFFEKYIEAAKENTQATESLDENSETKDAYLQQWKQEYEQIVEKIPELPLSNIWIAQHTISLLPEDCVLHLGILNSLRSWNFFEISDSILCYSNTGGFGIDGGVSSLVGASLANPDKLYFGVVGDLAFFYDLNVLGNRHVGNNIRLLLINNGRGTEFRNYNHKAAHFGEDADAFMAAAGHFGNQSLQVVRHYAEDLGFEYLCASNKEEYLKQMQRLVSAQKSDKPILLEVFTDSQDESDALEIINNLMTNSMGKMRQAAKDVLGEKGVNTIKKIIKW